MKNPLSRWFAAKPAKKTYHPAHVERGLGSNVFEGFSDLSMPYENPDDLVDKHGVEVFQTMWRRDDQLRSSTSYRQLAGLSTGWQMVAGGEDPTDEEAAAYVQHVFDDMRGSFIQTLLNMQHAQVGGHSEHEIVWAEFEKEGEWKGKQGYSRLKHRDPAYFSFKLDQHGEIDEEGIWQEQDAVSGGGDYIKFKREEIVYHVYNPKFENPYGNSDYRPAYRPYFIKDGAWRAWAFYLERAGYPLVTGRSTADADADDQSKLLAMLKQLRKSMVAVLKPDWRVEFIQPNHYPNIQLYDKLILRSNQSMARALLLPRLVAETADAGGAYALGKEHGDQFSWVLGFDRKGLSEVVNTQLVRPLIEHNFSGVAMPRFELKAFDREDLESLARMVKMLIEMNLPVAVPWVRDTLHIPTPAEDDEMIAGTPLPGLGDEPEVRAANDELWNTVQGDGPTTRTHVHMGARKQNKRPLTALEQRVDFMGLNAEEDADSAFSGGNFAVIFEDCAQQVEARAKKDNGGRPKE